MLRWFAQLEASTFLAAELLGQGHRRELLEYRGIEELQ